MQFVKFAPDGYKEKELYIRKDQVSAIRADRDIYEYTHIWLTNGIRFRVREPLSEVLNELGIKP